MLVCLLISIFAFYGTVNMKASHGYTLNFKCVYKSKVSENLIAELA